MYLEYYKRYYLTHYAEGVILINSNSSDILSDVHMLGGSEFLSSIL
jgi:hypothetical protein